MRFIIAILLLLAFPIFSFAGNNSNPQRVTVTDGTYTAYVSGFTVAPGTLSISDNQAIINIQSSLITQIGNVYEGPAFAQGSGVADTLYFNAVGDEAEFVTLYADRNTSDGTTTLNLFNGVLQTGGISLAGNPTDDLDVAEGAFLYGYAGRLVFYNLHTGTTGMYFDLNDVSDTIVVGSEQSTNHFRFGLKFELPEISTPVSAYPGSGWNHLYFKSDHRLYQQDTDGNETIVGVVATSQATPSNPAGTTDTTGKMMGLAGTITPVSTGKILIIISGDIANDTIADGAAVQIRYGTGTAPANADALTGTAVGGLVSSTNPNIALATLTIPFSLNAVVTGLTLGTAYWIDTGLKAITGGTATISNVSISVIEV